MSVRLGRVFPLLPALLWGGETPAPRKLEAPAGQGVYSLAFSPDGKTLASGNYDGTLRVWDAGTGKELRSIPCGGSSVYSVSFSPDGMRVAAGNMANPTKVWDPITGLPVLPLLSGGRIGSTVKLAVFSPDGKSIAGDQLDTLCLWDASTGRERWRAKGHASWVAALRFSPDGKVVASRDLQDVILREAATGAEIRRFPAGAGLLAFSPDGRLLAAGSAPEGPVILREMASGKEILRLKGGASDWAVAFSPDGRIVAASGRDPGISLWATDSGRLLATLKGHGANRVSSEEGSATIPALAFSPDGKTLASGGGDGTVLLSDLSGIRPAPPVLPAADPRELWATLGGEDAAKAYAAVQALSALGVKALEGLPGAKSEPGSDPEVRALLVRLDDPGFPVREAAFKALQGLGHRAEAEVRKTLQGNPSVEARHQMERLLEPLDAPAPLLTGEALRRSREAWVLERISGKP